MLKCEINKWKKMTIIKEIPNREAKRNNMPPESLRLMTSLLVTVSSPVCSLTQKWRLSKADFFFNACIFFFFN